MRPVAIHPPIPTNQRGAHPLTTTLCTRCPNRQVNGFTSLNLTKLDVLDDLDEIQVGVRYMYEGKELDSMPSNLQVLR